jgi:hypothetical protein
MSISGQFCIKIMKFTPDLSHRISQKKIEAYRLPVIFIRDRRGVPVDPRLHNVACWCSHVMVLDIDTPNPAAYPPRIGRDRKDIRSISGRS